MTVSPEYAPRDSRTLCATRRGFLRFAGHGAALTALAQLPVIPGLALATPARDGSRFFGAGETEILTQIAERMVFTGEPTSVALRDTGCIDAIDALCSNLAPSVAGQVRMLLRAYEYGPLFLDLSFSRFTRMSAEQQDASLRSWQTSRLALRRLGFAGMRNLCLYGFYSQPESWQAIGYAGPLLARGSTS